MTRRGDEGEVDGRPLEVSPTVTDPNEAEPEGRRVLVVSTVDDVGAALDPHVHEGDVVKVVVPVVRQGFLDWLANDQRAFAHAEEVAARTADDLSGMPVEVAAGEEDVELAIADALATFPADELVVVVGREDEEALRATIHRDDGDGTWSRSYAGMAFRVVAV